jgi:hypothetical protein
VIVRAFSFAHFVASPDELWNGILRGTVRTSIGIRRQPKAVQASIRAAFDRLVQASIVEGGVAFKVASGRRPRGRAKGTLHEQPGTSIDWVMRSVAVPEARESWIS